MPGAVKTLSNPFAPWSPGVDGELSYMSGVDSSGDGAASDWWQTTPVDPFARKWGGVAPGTPAGTVTYTFAPGNDPLTSWSAADQAMVVAGMALWAAVTNIQFAPESGQNTANLTLFFNNDDSAATGTYEVALGPAGEGQPYIGHLQGAAVIFDPSQLNIWDINSFTQNGGYGIDTIVHELGHVLGLGHAGPYNGSVDPATQQLGPYDTRQWSVMSYIDPWDSSAADYASYPDPGTNWGVSADGYYREPTTWMPLDILAAQRLYGLPVNTPLSGGQIFGFNCNIRGPIEPFFDFTVNTSPVVTLWDEGGGNTLDVSGFAAPATVDLRQGAFSSVDGMTNDIAIAFGTAIDNAVGGPGNTIFVVNGDNDSIAGGSGTNTALFTATGNYTDNLAGAGRVVSDRMGASDTLTGVQALEFTGGNDTIASGVGGAVVVTGGGDEIFLSASAQVTLGSADTLVATGGFTEVTAADLPGQRGDFVFGGGSGLVLQAGASPDTVVGSQVTVLGAGGALDAYGEGALQAQGGAGYAVLASFGASSETVQSGQGGGLLVGGGGGNNLLTAAPGAGATAIFGGGQGDEITLQNAVQDTVIAGPGAETVNATAALGGSVVYGGSGGDLMLGGSGSDFFAAGSGSDTMAAGGGINGFLFINGQAGGTDYIDGWTPGQDWLFLIGYGPGADAAAAASQVQEWGNTLVTLADHTQIWFMGTHGVAAGAFG